MLSKSVCDVVFVKFVNKSAFVYSAWSYGHDLLSFRFFFYCYVKKCA